MADFQWNIHREARSWTAEEFRLRWPLTPEKLECIDGKMLWSDEDRLNMLAMLLENVGIDAAIQLAPAKLWREALAEAER